MTTGICLLQHRKDPDRPRRAEVGLLVCYGCEQQLIRALEELPAMWGELIDRHLGSPAGGAPITGTPERAVPYRDAVGDERVLIRQQLASWCALVAEDRSIGTPPSSKPTATAPYLLEHLTWLLQQPFVDEFGAEILERHTNAHTLLYPDGRRRFRIGPCTEWYDVPWCDWIDKPGHPRSLCPGFLYAIIRDTDSLLPSELQCSACGFEVPASGWVTYGRKLVVA